ncbi:hypothetical protein GCK72_021038 [Caenorhabditis remanei]|uniref:Uncharacterized protein n=1 Tax=Caenorhabditis remanei TaxID=31234 RepID=A0A6A5GIS5_CAERE|nr:hypothetical protein GCK72_021038 [Caenorhabditis remanei]KAF1754475.1 hypothetical protein GCK72_021038 [Caenorhabditis remanei]
MSNNRQSQSRRTSQESFKIRAPFVRTNHRPSSRFAIIEPRGEVASEVRNDPVRIIWSTGDNKIVSSFWFNEVCIDFKDIKAVSQDEEEQEGSCSNVGTSYRIKAEVGSEPKETERFDEQAYDRQLLRRRSISTRIKYDVEISKVNNFASKLLASAHSLVASIPRPATVIAAVVVSAASLVANALSPPPPQRHSATTRTV